MNKFNAVIFDLDGTLLDTLDDIADAVNAALIRMKFPPHAIETYKAMVGDGVANLALRALPEGHADEDTIQRCVELVREEYAQRWSAKTRPYHGIPELLHALDKRGIRKAVLSNKPDDFTKLSIGYFLSAWTFEAVVGGSPAVLKKPDATAAIEITRLMNVAPASCIFLGDTNVDMLTAVAAGMYPVGALWGFRDAAELKANGAKALIHHPSELLHYL